MGKITTIILTKNEELNITDCLERLKWCDEVIVLDSFSSDHTVEIARQFGVHVVQLPFQNFADQRNAAIDIAESDWIFFVDADERVTDDLAQEVKLATLDQDCVGWWIPRKNNYFGKWLNYGGFFPDYQFRLLKKDKCRFDPQQKVHEKPILDGRTGYLQNALIHYCYQNLSDLKKAKERYAGLLAEIHYERGLKPSYHMVAAPFLTFFQQCFILQGYKDGKVGLLISLVWAYYAFDEYWKLWGLWKAAGKK
jgi:glycosyltransferase involved in cell wall biosynthesis